MPSDTHTPETLTVGTVVPKQASDKERGGTADNPTHIPFKGFQHTSGGGVGKVRVVGGAAPEEGLRSGHSIKENEELNP